MRPVDEAKRRMLIMWSVSLCVGSLLLAPLAAKSSLELSAQQELGARDFQLPALTAETPARRNVPLNRDPFSADATRPDGGAAKADPAPISNTIVGSSVRAGASIGIVLPPNSGALGAAPPPTAGSATVAAIITGDRGRALVYEGERSRIISVGDRLEGRKVTGISSDGIHLDDGSIRPLSETQP